jgi:hypothetical protein
MFGIIKSGFACFVLLLVVVPSVVVSADRWQKTEPTPPSWQLEGKWRIKFRLSAEVEKTLIFETKTKGTGSFLLMDTGPDNQPVFDPTPAVWAALSNNRVSISAHAELPLGTCCREIGALIFKGKFTSENSISGNLIFVTNIEEEENPIKFRSLVGTFTATRIAGDAQSRQTAANEK